MYCAQCGVPQSYYISAEHAKRPSCRNSISGYHRFESIGCWAKLYAFISQRRKKESTRLNWPVALDQLESPGDDPEESRRTGRWLATNLKRKNIVPGTYKCNVLLKRVPKSIKHIIHYFIIHYFCIHTWCYITYFFTLMQLAGFDHRPPLNSSFLGCHCWTQ